MGIGRLLTKRMNKYTSSLDLPGKLLSSKEKTPSLKGRRQGWEAKMGCQDTKATGELVRSGRV